MSDAWKTVTIPQKDFGTRSDDRLRGFEAGVAASQKPAADEIERLRAENEKLKTEIAAIGIYDSLPYDGPEGTAKPAWVPFGNSLKQDEARRLASAPRR